MANIPPFNRAENALFVNEQPPVSQNPMLVESIEERSEINQQYYDEQVRDLKNLYVSRKFDPDTSQAERKHLDEVYPAFTDPRKAYIDQEMENQKKLAYILLQGPQSDEDYELIMQVIRREYVPETKLFLSRTLKVPKRGYWNFNKPTYDNPMNVLNPETLSVQWQLGKKSNRRHYMPRLGEDALPWDEERTWLEDFTEALNKAFDQE